MCTEWQQDFMLLMNHVISLGSCCIKEMDLREKPRSCCCWIMQFDMWYLCRQLERFGCAVVIDGFGTSDTNPIQPFTAHHVLQHSNTSHLTILYGSCDDLWDLNPTEFSEVFPYNTLTLALQDRSLSSGLLLRKHLSLHDNHWHETKHRLTSN